MAAPHHNYVIGNGAVVHNSFNKSHSVAYSKISCSMAWWKYHYPVDFYAATLTVDTGEAQRYIFEVVEKGIPIVPPHVNVSTDVYVSDGTKIYMPLSVIKHLGKPGQQSIINNRPYSSIKDFMTKVPKKLVRRPSRLGLFQLQAFDGLDGEAKDLQIEVPEKMTRSQTHIAYMGFMIPPRTMLERVKAASVDGWIAGIIADKVEKESQYGKYCVYYLLPRGSVWSRQFMDLKPGQWVKVRHKKNSGKILKVEPLR